MITIWKYVLSPVKRQTVKMQVGAKIISTQVQNEAVCLWAIVDDQAEKEEVEIALIGTGESCNCLDQHFIGTVQIGWVVLHVFKITNSGTQG